jgi:hypothetical protein
VPRSFQFFHRTDAEAQRSSIGAPSRERQRAELPREPILKKKMKEPLGRNNWRLALAKCFHHLWTQVQMRRDELRRGQCHPLI